MPGRRPVLNNRPASWYGSPCPGHAPPRRGRPRRSTSRTPGRARLRPRWRGTRMVTDLRPSRALTPGRRRAARPTRISARRLGSSMFASLCTDHGYVPTDRSRRMRPSAGRVRCPGRAGRRGCRAIWAWRQRSAARSRSWWSKRPISYQTACMIASPPLLHLSCTRSIHRRGSRPRRLTVRFERRPIACQRGVRTYRSGAGRTIGGTRSPTPDRGRRDGRT